jgi:hypothetical protein
VNAPKPGPYLGESEGNSYPYCADVQGFDGGELRLNGDFGDEPGYIRIRWEEWGVEPAMDFVGAEE